MWRARPRISLEFWTVINPYNKFRHLQRTVGLLADIRNQSSSQGQLHNAGINSETVTSFSEIGSSGRSIPTLLPPIVWGCDIGNQ